MVRLPTIFYLGVKELWSLWRDPIMLFLIFFVFTVAILLAGTSAPETLNRAALAIVDEDRSALSARLESAFMLPQFLPPAQITLAEMDPALDAGRYVFVLVIPKNFQRDLASGTAPSLQLNIDATRMSQAFIGAGVIQRMIGQEASLYFGEGEPYKAPAVQLASRMRFNANLDPAWFTSLMELVNHITMLSMILVGAALIREREHSTIEHLLSMPVTPTEILLAKTWSMAAVVLLTAAASLVVIVQGVLGVPIEGSRSLFLAGTALHLFAASGLGIFLATVARNMPQFGLLVLLVLIPLEQLSGAVTPRESMPAWVQNLMLLAPTTHFTELSQAILYRGAGLEIVWESFLMLGCTGFALFALSLLWFRSRLLSSG